MTGLLLNCCMVHGLHINTHTYTHILYTTPFMVHACISSALICTQYTTHYNGECTSTLSHTTRTQQHAYLLDIPWQPTCMKLGTGGLYQPIRSYMLQAGFIHVVCLGISNKSVAVPRQDSICHYS